MAKQTVNVYKEALKAVRDMLEKGAHVETVLKYIKKILETP